MSDATPVVPGSLTPELAARLLSDPAILGAMTDAERAEVDRLLSEDKVPWRPLPGPQSEAYATKATVTGYGGSAGGGKGLALWTLLPTPAGWIRMGDVSVGDELFDPSGAVCVVTGVSEVSHRPCYRLEFDDGSWLVSDDVHRWVTFDASELAALTRSDPVHREDRLRKRRETRAKGRRPVVATSTTPCPEAPCGTMRSTEEIAGSTRLPSGRSNHAIPVSGALMLPDADLLVPPYTLGAWLGDGASRCGGLTGEDAGVWEQIERDGFEVRHYSWNAQAHSIIGLKVLLRRLGVLENKHIPVAYLRSSYRQRLELLRGLMDTDGHAALDGGCEFDNTNEALACQVHELVLSLGIKATLTVGVAKIGGRIIGPKWRVKFVTSLPVFGLARKMARLRPVQRRVARFRYLVSCERVETEPTRCISVSSPSRQYLAGLSMIPTHNTDLACGLSITQHRRVGIFRQNGTELTGVVDRVAELMGSRDGYNGTEKIWRFERWDGGEVQVEFGSFPAPGDVVKYQGRPHDLLVFDEASNMRESDVRFLMGWLRTVDPRQRKRVLMTFNPPTNAEGRWVVRYFAPWLDKKHPRPAKPGELRYFAVLDGKEVEVDGPEPIRVGRDLLEPQSRTFIPSRVSDNPYLMNTGYRATLEMLPEPLRSQMLFGDFNAGIEDDPQQVIPTAWVEAAQARWKPMSVLPKMMSLGVDVARGGRDSTILARRHEGMWFDAPLVYPGSSTPDGPTVAGLCIAANRDRSPIHIDVIGIGSSPFDFLMQAQQQVVGVNVSEKARGLDKSGRLGFKNLRSELWWRMREALDPLANNGIALPPDPRLLADLCAPTWQLSGASIDVCGRDKLIERIGRSPDFGSAYVLALMDTPKLQDLETLYGKRVKQGEWNPYDRERMR